MTRTRPTWLVIIGSALPMFMATLDNLVVTFALPAIHTDMRADLEQLQWITNAYTLSFAALMLFAITLGDRYGRRTLFLGGIAVFTAASVAAALATDPAQLIAARAVQGVGAAAVQPLSLALLASAVPERRRALAIGIWGGVAGLGVALGPVVGGAVVEGWDWSAIFWLNLPVGVIAIPLALIALPNSFGAKARADLVGVLLAAAGVLGVVFGIVRGNPAGWDSAEVMVPLVAGGALLVAFVLWERRVAAPLLPLRLFRDRGFSVANAVAVVFNFGAFGSVFLLTQFLQIVQGHTPLTAGVMTMPWTLAAMVVAPLAGLLAPRLGTRTLIMTGLVLLAAGLFWIGGTLADDVAYTTQLPGYVVAGIGMGLVFAPISTAVLAGIAPEDQGTAVGTNSTLREVGVALGIAVLTAVFTGAGGVLTPTGFTEAARPAVLVGAATLAAAALVALLLPGGRAPHTGVRASARPEAAAPGVVAAAARG